MASVKVTIKVGSIFVWSQFCWLELTEVTYYCQNSYRLMYVHPAVAFHCLLFQKQKYAE